MYRARVIEMGGQTATFIYIDCRDGEMKDKANLWMLTMKPVVVKVEVDTGAKTVNTEQEDELVEEEVLGMVEDDGTTISKFFVNCEEISFFPEIGPVEALPWGINTDGGKRRRVWFPRDL